MLLSLVVNKRFCCKKWKMMFIDAINMLFWICDVIIESQDFLSTLLNFGIFWASIWDFKDFKLANFFILSFVNIEWAVFLIQQGRSFLEGAKTDWCPPAKFQPPRHCIRFRQTIIFSYLNLSWFLYWVGNVVKYFHVTWVQFSWCSF